MAVNGPMHVVRALGAFLGHDGELETRHNPYPETPTNGRTGGYYPKSATN